ncbi:MAG TPA: type VI secretion system baseplate subunit TssE [Gemmatimonas sp.]|uniref:type VI secretion system baseplate subunit TssE n=1 Tax=Gemmatimonas sp. TaxID=1962908 RepID=UPI002ED7F9BD
MARTELDRNVQPSLLDRLIDESPLDGADAPKTHEESARLFRISVQRDVELLLNTRRSIVPVDSMFREVRHSVHEFGLPDTTGISPGTPEGRQRLTDDVRDTILRFEPRLANVVVKLGESDRIKTPQVRFVVSATLRMDPTPEQIVFDTVLDMSTGAIDVQDKP